MFIYLNSAHLDLAANLIGDLHILSTIRTIHFAQVYLKDFTNYDWCFMKRTEKTPSFNEMDFLNIFLRSWSDVIINSVGKKYQIFRYKFFFFHRAKIFEKKKISFTNL